MYIFSGPWRTDPPGMVWWSGEHLPQGKLGEKQRAEGYWRVERQSPQLHWRGCQATDNNDVECSSAMLNGPNLHLPWFSWHLLPSQYNLLWGCDAQVLFFRNICLYYQVYSALLLFWIAVFQVGCPTWISHLEMQKQSFEIEKYVSTSICLILNY